MKSLFLIGQPRGFTTPVYRFVLQATKLKHSVMSGEVLNVNKDGKSYAKQNKMYHYVQDDTSYEFASEILKSYLSDYLIKDVINPYLSLRFVREHPEAFNVLHIYRDPQQCMNHQEARGWPRRDPSPYMDEFMSFPTVYFDDIVVNPEKLWEKVEDLGYEVERFDYTDSPSFQTKKRKVTGNG